MMTINELCTAAHSDAKAKGWYDDGERNFGEAIALVTSELSEALEAHRNGWMSCYSRQVVTMPVNEEWRTIDWLNGGYLVSNYGNVKSPDRFVWNGRTERISKSRILRPGLTKTGYMTVSICGKTQKVHHLVALAFIGERNGMVCNHINGDKTCNWVSNLEWCTHSQNNIHALATGLRHKCKGILSYEDKIDIAFRFKQGETAPSIYNDYIDKVSLSAIKAVRQRGIDRYTQSLEFELADAVIRIADLCGYMGIDLESHIIAKMKYNRTRPRKHGKEY